MRNKKANIMVIIVFFILLFVILFLGFVMVVGSSVVNYVFDIAVPEVTDLGSIGGANLTQAADYTITPLNTIIQNFTWVTGVIYMLMIIGSVGFAITMRSAPNKWLIGFYFMCVIILVLGSIFISNMYEEFYNGTDEFGTILKEHILLSFMVLHAPKIFTVLAFLTGIFLFSGMQQEEFI